MDKKQQETRSRLEEDVLYHGLKNSEIIVRLVSERKLNDLHILFATCRIDGANPKVIQDIRMACMIRNPKREKSIEAFNVAVAKLAVDQGEELVVTKFLENGLELVRTLYQEFEKSNSH